MVRDMSRHVHGEGEDAGAGAQVQLEYGVPEPEGENVSSVDSMADSKSISSESYEPVCFR